MKIRLQNISLSFKNRSLLENVSLEIPSGQLVGLLGRNGTGKSTLLSTLCGLREAQGGDIFFSERSITEFSRLEFSRTVSYVSTAKIRIANLTCEQVVSLGRTPYTNWIGRLSDEDRAVVEQSLKLVGMESFASKSINKISDGELQRVMIARALAQDTPIILLDEPTAHLDIPNKFEVCNLLRNLAEKEGKTIIFSTHDLDIALKSCHSFVLIENLGASICSSLEDKQAIYDEFFKAH